jgi:hypothetical protein
MTSAPCSKAIGAHRPEVLRPGQQVHRWTLLREATPAASSDGRWRPLWLCRCLCDSEKIVLDQRLRLALKLPADESLDLNLVGSMGNLTRAERGLVILD